MKTLIRSAIATAILLLAATTAAGCVLGEGEPPSWFPGAGEQTTEVVTEEPRTPMPEGSHGHGTEVFMMGRSVMSGWFAHWEYDGQGPVLREGYALYYHEVPGPPEIGDSAAAAVAELPAGTVVFFKLCFVDFWASDPSEVDANVSENMGYVRQVHDACAAQGLKLVVGNALPQVIGDTNVALVDTHLAYNDALARFAAENADVTVFDLYGLLADQQGALPKGLAVTPDDSHLNDVAYRILDDAYFPLLDSLE